MTKLSLGFGAILALASPAAAQERPQERKLVFAFKDASIEALLLYVSRVTGWIFVQEAPARGTVTAYSHAEVPPSMCLEFLNVTLRQHGLTVRNPSWPRAPVPGETLRVLELAKALPTLPEVHVGIEAEEIPVSDEMRTQITPLKSVSAAEAGKDLGDILRKAMGEGGQVAVSAFSNSIVLTGRSEGIRRAVEILRVIDQTASAQLKVVVFPLRHADAGELAKTLNEVYKREAAKPEAGAQGQLPGFLRMMRSATEGDRSGGSSRSPAHEMIRITAEPRTNSLVVSATDENLDLIRGLLSRLDSAEAARNTYIVPLRNADAATIAAILENLWREQGKSASSSRVGQPNQARSDGTLSPGQTPFGGTPSTSNPRVAGGGTPRR
jgi:type II secretory pathway component GspD/PulD (secretin)